MRETSRALRAAAGLAGWAVCAAAQALGAVANDDFANAMVLTGSRGVITCRNEGATLETDEPAIIGKGTAGGASLWFQWTAPTSGSFKVDTESSSFDTLLGVYTGSSLSSLTKIASHDNIDRSTNQQSWVTFTATAGTVYRITVDGKSGTFGYVVLSWAPAGTATNPAPANNAFAAAQSISGLSGSLTGSTINATRETGEPVHADVPNGKTIWYRWTSPESGLARFDTLGSDFDTVIAVYEGTSLSGLTRVEMNNDSGNLVRQSQVIFRSVAGTEYRIVIGGVQMWSGVIREGNPLLNWSLDPAAGNNDLFAYAQPLQGPYGAAVGMNVGATVEAGEPAPLDNPGGCSIWYRWTAPTDGTVIFDTTGTALEAMAYTYPLLTIYTGGSLPYLQLVADNYNHNPMSPMYYDTATFQAQAGVEYFISVDGFNDYMLFHTIAQGAVSLSWRQPGVVQLSAPRPAEAQSVEMTLVSEPGRACTILCSTNLTTWTEHTNLTPTSFSTLITADARPGYQPMKFFRARLNP